MTAALITVFPAPVVAVREVVIGFFRKWYRSMAASMFSSKVFTALAWKSLSLNSMDQSSP